jgi:hypothetical protein
MASDTELHRRLGCRLSLQKISFDTTAIAAEAVETEHESLDLLTASSFDLVSTPPPRKNIFLTLRGSSHSRTSVISLLSPIIPACAPKAAIIPPSGVTQNPSNWALLANSVLQTKASTSTYCNLQPSK